MEAPGLGLVTRQSSKDDVSRLRKSTSSDDSTASAPSYVPFGARCTLECCAWDVGIIRVKHVTYQRHTPQFPIHEIDDVALWVLDAKVDQDEHDLVTDDVRPHVEEIYGQCRVELEVGFSR